LGEDRVADLCDVVASTPAEEANNVLLGLQAGDQEKAAQDLDRRYRLSRAGEGRTRLAIALLALGDSRAARAELAIGADPTDRVRFIHQFPGWHGDLTSLPKLLAAADDPAVRSCMRLVAASTRPA